MSLTTVMMIGTVTTAFWLLIFYQIWYDLQVIQISGKELTKIKVILL
jgi:hypothetical protein